MGQCASHVGRKASHTDTNTHTHTLKLQSYPNIGANLFNAADAHRQTIVVHVVLQVFCLERGVRVVGAKNRIDFLATLPIRVQYEAQTARAVERPVRIMAHLIARLVADALVNIKFTLCARVARGTRTLLRFYAFAIVVTGPLANRYK